MHANTSVHTIIHVLSRISNAILLGRRKTATSFPSSNGLFHGATSNFMITDSLTRGQHDLTTVSVSDKALKFHHKMYMKYTLFIT